MYRVKVIGSSASDAFGVDVHVVNGPADVWETGQGGLVVLAKGTPARPHPTRTGETLKARRSTMHGYPRGGWSKVILEDIVTTD